MSQPDIDARACPSRHIVQFFDSHEFLAESVARYIAEGLELGQAAVLVCRSQHRELVERNLELAGWPTTDGLSGADVMFLDAADTLGQLMVAGRVDATAFESVIGRALWKSGRGGRRRVRAYGEMVSILCERGQIDEALRLEQLWNELAHRNPFWLLCSYHVSQFGRDGLARQFHDICDAHSDVHPSEEWMRLDVPAQLRRVAELERQAAQNAHLLKELQEAMQKQAEASRHKDEFLAMLGHELRNPLAPIFTALQVMSLRGNGGAREREVIKRQALHLTHLVDDLLDVSRVARGKIELRKQPIELAEVAAKAVEIASPLFEERGHHLTVAIPREGVVVDADPVRLSQVLANLLTNAAKYTGDGGSIFLGARHQGEEIEILVRDDGKGIPPELLTSIFDVFVQGNQEMDRSYGGLGLGLALVQSLTRLHGGKVSAHSEGVGKGSTFIVHLPAASKEIKASDLRDLSHGHPASAPRIVSKVLLVDDNEDAADVLAELLRLQGCDVSVAHDGPQALELAKTAAHDVALVDLGLPVMDGFELADRLGEMLGASRPKLIAVTGYGQDRDRARTKEAGFAAHLVKPVNLDELIRSINGA